MKNRKMIIALLTLAIVASLLVAPANAASVSFTDVPSTHWAYKSITKLAENGVVNGVGDGTSYAPEGTVTAAQFIKMVTCQFFADSIGYTGGDPWYQAYVNTATYNRLLANVGGIGSIVTHDNYWESNITRYDMATIAYNTLDALEVALPYEPDTSKIADWADVPKKYQAVVAACYELGLITGIDTQGTFCGDGYMTRAQAAIVIDRVNTYLASDPLTAQEQALANLKNFSTIEAVDLSSITLPSNLSYVNGAIIGAAGDLYAQTAIQIPTYGADRIIVTVSDDTTSHLAFWDVTANWSTADVESGSTYNVCCTDVEVLEVYTRDQKEVGQHFAITSIERVYFNFDNEIPAGAQAVTDVTELHLKYGDTRVVTEDYIYCGSHDNVGSPPSISTHNPGYTKLTFSVYVTEDHTVSLACRDTWEGTSLLRENLEAGSIKTYTIDITGCKALALGGYMASGSMSDIYFYNLYFHN